MTRSAPRYAVYLTPPAAHPLWQLGCTWLGRDPAHAPPYPGPAREFVREPWRYGFHATLKAPMRLAPDIGEAVFLAAVRGVARGHHAFPMPRLAVGTLAGFLALVPQAAVPAGHPLRRLADDCVTRLDHWRATPTVAELQRQDKVGLDPRQRAQVSAYGYPYVLDDWRCHFTLSDGLAGVDAPSAAALRAQAEQHFGPALDAPWTCDALSVFVEPAAGQAFELRERFGLSK
jgi:Protein of unknown function (DUF1045)